jgi:hypothetical protein
MTSSSAVSERLERHAVETIECTIPEGMTIDAWRRSRACARRGPRRGRRHLGAAAVLLLLIPVVAVLGRPGAATAATNCVGSNEARASGSDEDGPPKFSDAFYRLSLSLDVSLDGLEGQEASLAGSDTEQTPTTQEPPATQNPAKSLELPVSIEDVCRVPRRLKTQGQQLSGTDGVALVSSATRVVKDHRALTGTERTDELGGADTATIIGRLLRPRRWRQDDDGEPIPTFNARRVTITD